MIEFAAESKSEMDVLQSLQSLVPCIVIMRIDCHVHISALSPENGMMSQRILRSIPFRFIQWRLETPVENDESEKKLETKLANTIIETDALDAAVVMAFDAVYDLDGNIDLGNTHLYVKNDYAIEVCKRNPKMLFAASVHPYRKDAVAEIERCVAAGAVMMKWLPVVQHFDPSDKRCIPFYEALAHYKLPLLSHTGGEKSLPNLNPDVMDPALLLPAIKQGVTVIAAHCGTRSHPTEEDFLQVFMRMAREHEHFYGDTAALCLPTRSYAIEPLLRDKVVRNKLVHGSDWPIISIPPILPLGVRQSIRLMADRNWMRRDVTIKRLLGFDDAYFLRAGKILRINKPTS